LPLAGAAGGANKPECVGEHLVPHPTVGGNAGGVAGLAEAVSPQLRQEGDDPVDGAGVWAEPQLAVVMVEAYKFGGGSGQRDPVGGADGQRIGNG
jgi:hypothetical protein